MKTKHSPNSTPVRRRGITLLWLGVVGCGLGLNPLRAEPPDHQHGHSLNPVQVAKSSSGSAAAVDKASRPALPPLPSGVTELKFGEFFVQPVGDRGLEFTDKLRGLDGKRVRLVGFMVRQEPALPGRFLLSPLPLELHQHDDQCFIDDLPPSTVQVFLPARHEVPVPYQRGLMWLTGTLSVGSRTEPDDRISLVRLTADLPKPAAKRHVADVGKGAERLLRTTQRAAP